MHGRQRCYLEEQSQLQAAIVLQVGISVQAVVHALHTHPTLSAHILQIWAITGAKCHCPAWTGSEQAHTEHCRSGWT